MIPIAAGYKWHGLPFPNGGLVTSINKKNTKTERLGKMHSSSCSLLLIYHITDHSVQLLDLANITKEGKTG